LIRVGQPLPRNRLVSSALVEGDVLVCVGIKRDWEPEIIGPAVPSLHQRSRDAMASMRGQYGDLVEVDVPIRPRDRTESPHRGLEVRERLDLGWEDVAEARSRWRLGLPEGRSMQPDGDSDGRIAPNVHLTDRQARLNRPLAKLRMRRSHPRT
jgi:hypothetical protein